MIGVGLASGERRSSLGGLLKGVLVVVFTAGFVLMVNVQSSWDWPLAKKAIWVVGPALVFAFGWWSRGRHEKRREDWR